MTLARIDDKGDRLVVVNMNAKRRGAISPGFVNLDPESLSGFGIILPGSQDSRFHFSSVFR